MRRFWASDERLRGHVGFQAIADIGGALEQAAGSADNDASRKWAGELSNYLDDVETIAN